MPDQVDQAQEQEEVWLDQRRRLPRMSVERGNGICRGCAEPIPPARLAVTPAALRCVDCQAEVEGACG